MAVKQWVLTRDQQILFYGKSEGNAASIAFILPDKKKDKNVMNIHENMSKGSWTKYLTEETSRSYERKGEKIGQFIES